MKIFAGIIGAVIGFVGIVLLAGLSDFGRNDPITTGMLVLVVFGPLGGFFGAWLGVSLARGMSGGKKTAGQPDGDKPPS